MDDTRAGEAFNLLLRSARDSAEGFRQGASLARNPVFQSLFQERAEAREKLVTTIEAEVRSFGGEPARMGTLMGEAHKLVTFAHNALSGSSDKGLVKELILRETMVIRDFESLSKAEAVPETARRIAAEALPTLTTEQQELEDLGEQFNHVSPAH